MFPIDQYSVSKCVDHTSYKKKVFLLQACLWPRGWVGLQLFSSTTMALERGELSAARPGRTLPPGETQ